MRVNCPRVRARLTRGSILRGHQQTPHRMIRYVPPPLPFAKQRPTRHCGGNAAQVAHEPSRPSLGSARRHSGTYVDAGGIWSYFDMFATRRNPDLENEGL
jgi:hypothetical protein